MFGDIKIAPSILSADFSRLGSEVEEVDKGGAHFIHIDVMDGHFVPNLTIGPLVISALRKVTDKVLDVHLMIDNAEQSVDWYIDAGADLITFHYEAVIHHHRLIQHIKSRGVNVGISLNPSTPIYVLEPVIDQLDMVLIMSVNPGFGGQSFIQNSVAKIEQLASLCQEKGVSPLIQVDGGITAQTAGAVCAAGADVLVAGSAVFGAADRVSAMEEILQAARAGDVS